MARRWWWSRRRSSAKKAVRDGVCSGKKQLIIDWKRQGRGRSPCSRLTCFTSPASVANKSSNARPCAEHPSPRTVSIRPVGLIRAQPLAVHSREPEHHQLAHGLAYESAQPADVRRAARFFVRELRRYGAGQGFGSLGLRKPLMPAPLTTSPPCCSCSGDDGVFGLLASSPEP